MQRALKSETVLKECNFAQTDVFIELQCFILDQRFPKVCIM